MSGSLPIGTIVNGYRVDALLSPADDSSVSYLAADIDTHRLTQRRATLAARADRWRERYGATALTTPINPGPRVVLHEYAPHDLSIRRGAMVLARSEQTGVFEWGRDRFQGEAQFLATMSHPNIVALFDHFSANGTDYRVVEHLSGGSLYDLVARHGLQVEAQVRAWLIPALHGLASIERSGAHHFGISPHSIMFRVPGGDAVLTDFGKARLRGRTQSHSSRVGTANPFAAPESLGAGGRTLDARSDIYAIGAVANFALTGEQPTTAGTRISGLADMSPTATHNRAAGGSPDFLRAIDRAFATNPASRYTGAAAMIEVLQGSRPSSVAMGRAPQALDNTVPLILLGVAAFLLIIIILALIIMVS